LAETPKYPSPPAFGLINVGAIGQPRESTSLCNPLIIYLTRKSTVKRGKIKLPYPPTVFELINEYKDVPVSVIVHTPQLLFLSRLR
jgi:hypothetical protein